MKSHRTREHAPGARSLGWLMRCPAFPGWLLRPCPPRLHCYYLPSRRGHGEGCGGDHPFMGQELSPTQIQVPVRPGLGSGPPGRRDTWLDFPRSHPVWRDPALEVGVGAPVTLRVSTSPGEHSLAAGLGQGCGGTSISPSKLPQSFLCLSFLDSSRHPLGTSHNTQ